MLTGFCWSLHLDYYKIMRMRSVTISAFLESSETWFYGIGYVKENMVHKKGDTEGSFLLHFILHHQEEDFPAT